MTSAIVNSDGNVLWLYRAVIETHCDLNVEYFPFDKQKCELKFYSWTFNGFELNLTVSDALQNILHKKYRTGKHVSFAVLLIVSISILPPGI